MIISSCLLAYSYNKYKEHFKNKRENFAGQAFASGASAGFVTFILVMAIIFFILEILVLFYAIIMAINCSKAGPERVVHIVLAIFFTLPYALIMVIFSACGKHTLRGEPFKFKACTDSSCPMKH